MAAPQASSRLEMLQARFQQKQLQEKEQKLLQLYDQQQQRAYQVVQRGSAGSNGSTGSNHSSTVGHTVTRTSSSSYATSTSQGGKVRQMFDERRQTGGAKGIDRSYPLEPLENKPRKQQTNGFPGQKNGNFTVARQSVTVKRVARADVNSNLNAGKPLLSYHEEITRDSSLGSPMQHEDKDDFDNENYLARYANDDQANQVQIEEMLDQETINRNRMMAKLHLMEYDETMKHRVRNDLESEEFPEELMVNVPDKLPKRTATKKLSQAEARLERFKNANAKRTTLTKTTSPTTAVTKKRTETLYPASKSISREYGGTKSSSLKSSIAARKLGDTQSPFGDSKNPLDKSSRHGSETSSLEFFKGRTTPSRDPEFFSLESDRSATTFSIKSVDSADSTDKVPTVTKDKNKDWEYIPEDLKPFLSRDPPTKNLPRQSELDVATITSKEKYKSNEPPETIRRKRNGHVEFLGKRNGRPSTAIGLKPSQSWSRKTVASDVKSIGVKSRRDSRDTIGLRDSSTKYYCRETERGGTTMSLDTKVQPLKEAKKIILKYTDTSRPSSRASSSSEGGRTYSRRLETSPQFFGVESERSATTMTVIPETIRKSRSGSLIFDDKTTSAKNTGISLGNKTDFPRFGVSISLKAMDNKRSRSASPKFYSRETVKSNIIDKKNIPPRSPSAGKLIEKREPSSEFYCRESKKSATTASLKPRITNDDLWIDGRWKSPPRPFRQKATKDLTTKSDKKVVDRPNSRGSSTSLGNSTLGRGKQLPRRESGHILRSIGLIRDVMKRQQLGHKINGQKTQALKFEINKKLPDPRTGRKSSTKIPYRPETPDRTRGTPILVPSPKGLTSPEVDTEIQKMILPHEYIERDKVADTKTSISRATKKPILAPSKASFSTYSTSKSCKKGAPSMDRRSSSDSKSSIDHGRTVSLKQITRNKSDAERSRSPWPRHGSSSSDGANRKITRECSRALGQTCSPPRSRNVESTTYSKSKAIFMDPKPTEKNCRFGKSSPTSAATFPSSRRRAGEKPRGIDGTQVLRSTDLVLKALSGNDIQVTGRMTKLGTRNAGRSDPNTAKPCYVAHRITGPKLKDKQESSSRIGLAKRIQNDKAESKCTTRKTEDFHGERHKVVKKDKAVYSRSDDEKSRISTAPNNPYTAQSQAKSFSNTDDKLPDVVLLKTSQNENHRAIITSDTPRSSLTGIEGGVSKLIRKNTMEGNTDGKTRINDYIRTDSVESALKRFDSIGAESISYETLSISEAVPREKRHLNAENVSSEENKTAKIEKRSRDKDEIGIRTRGTISLKTLDQKQQAAHEKSMSSKPIPKRSSVAAVRIPKSKATATSSVSRISETSGSRSPKKFAKARDSMEIVRMSVKSKPATCKRKLFQDLDSESESQISKSKRTVTLRQQKPNENDECSISTQQLHSIADIRESIDSGRTRSASSSSRLTVTRRQGESTPRSAIASKARRLSTERKVESVRKKLAGLRDLSSKDRTALSRMAKSPSPEPAQRKATEPSRASRRSVPVSPSKSPDTDAPRMQDSRITRRPAAARGDESNGPRRAVTKKSTDVVDGTVVENGHQERVAEGNSENQSKKADAFVIEFDEQPTKEGESRKPPPPLRKQSAEKLTSPTQPTRPGSSISSSSNGSSNSQTSGTRVRMGSRAKTPGAGSVTSKGQGSMKSAMSSVGASNLVPCKMCGRRFAQDRVSLHEEICAKTAQKKRKTFDTVLYRVRGTELEPFVKKGIGKKQSESKTKQPDPKSNWRRKHEDFINAIRSAKQVQAHLAAGGKLSDLPPPPASDTSDYIQCPHCGRKFNQAAAERHIPKCEHMLHNKPAHSRAQKTKR